MTVRRAKFIGCVAIVSLVQGFAQADDDKHQLAQAVSQLCDSGFASRRVPLADLDRGYQQAQKSLGKSDPYLDYAYSLVLAKNLYTSQAEQALRKAADSGSPVVLLAREDSIYNRLRAQDYLPAMDMLVELAETIGAIPPDGAGSTDARRSAQWIGRIVGYLEGPLGNEKVAQRAKISDPALRRALGPEYTKLYVEGRTAIFDTQRELLDQLTDVSKKAETKKAESQQSAQQRAVRADEKQKKAQDAAKELDKVAKNEMDEMTKKMQALDKQFTSSMESEQRLITTQTTLRAEIMRLKNQLQATPANSTDAFGVPTRSIIDQQIQTREAEYAMTVNDYALLLESRFSLSNTANDLLERREALQHKYAASAEEAAESVALAKQWKNRLQETAKRHAETPVAKLPEVGKARRKISSLEAYDQRSINDRRELLMAVLGIQSSKNE